MRNSGLHSQPGTAQCISPLVRQALSRYDAAETQKALGSALSCPTPSLLPCHLLLLWAVPALILCLATNPAPPSRPSLSECV